MTNLTTTKLARVSSGTEVSVAVLKAETEAVVGGGLQHEAWQ